MAARNALTIVEVEEQVTEVCGCGRHRLLADSHLIRVCATCGRTRDQAGTWIPAGPVIAAHPELHVMLDEALCLDCLLAAGSEGGPPPGARVSRARRR